MRAILIVGFGTERVLFTSSTARSTKGSGKMTSKKARECFILSQRDRRKSSTTTNKSKWRHDFYNLNLFVNLFV